MKVKIVFWLFMCCTSLCAQPVVVANKDLAKKGISEKQLDSQYGLLPDQPIPLDIPFSVAMKIKKAYQEALGKDVGVLSITTHLYLNEKGKIDYLIYNISESTYILENGRGKSVKIPYKIDSLGIVLSERLPELLAEFVSNRNWSRKDHLKLYTMLGTAQSMERAKPPKKEGFITDISDATSVTDTLKVKSLSLQGHLLTSLPEVIYRFPNLEVLVLANNDITALSIDMSRLPKLKNIDLTNNLLTEGQIRFTPNKSLKILNLQKNQLVDIPVTVRDCKGLESLWLGKNMFSGLQNRSFKRLRHIKDLNLYKAEIAVLPKGIKKMRKLEVLDLYYNQLEVLPRSITRLKRITHLAVANNVLTSLPSKISRMKNVTNLYAHHNRLSKLPESIVKMKKLQILDLGFNWFTNFPAEVAGFTNLQELDLTSNNFHTFPQGLLEIKHLGKLFLRGNPFIEDRPNVSYSNQLDDLKSKNIEVFH